MTMITVMQIGALTFMTLLPVALSVILYMAERQPWTKKFSYGVKQAIIGVLFGLVAVLATEAGISVNGAVLNVRNAAPLTAGLLFGGPAGIIAGVIGGAYRWFATYWGAGAFSQLACTIGTVLAGLFGAGCRRIDSLCSHPDAIRKPIVDIEHDGWIFRRNVIVPVQNLAVGFAVRTNL